MATAGPNGPLTTIDSSVVGTLAWTTPNNAQVQDSVVAISTGTAGSANLISHYLKCTNFNFSIPLTATINGILLTIVEAKPTTGTGAAVVDNIISIVDASGTIGSTNKATATAWSTTLASVTYGTSSDLWGLTWTPANINNSNFGVVISAKISSGVTRATVADIDFVSLTITYTPKISGDPNLFVSD